MAAAFAVLQALAAPPPALPLANRLAPFVGDPFFLLSDASFASSEAAKVRLEVNAPETLEQAGGVDILVYRIDDPLAFLQRQKNLHRVQVDAPPSNAGLSNTLTHVWDSWVVKSRLAWQKLFSNEARRSVTAEAPELKSPKALTKPSVFEEPPQFKPIAGLALAERFRYPVQAAKPIGRPKGLALAGSSSDFINPSQGNVWVPLGKRAPGLYLVEAIAGQHRATTLLFVSDTVALTKVSGEQMLVWTVQRGGGAPVPKTRLLWTDGVGVLKSGESDAQGITRLDRQAPEQTYLFGEDPAGGVFISENFYYDSEIHAAKVYTVTDRPLYRPGDWVQVKVTGREFRSARESVGLKDAELALTALDPSGQVIAAQTLRLNAQGADTRFALPDNAVAGGYELRLAMADDIYSAAFRVADYQKPHFDIVMLTDKPDFAVGQAISGKLQLAYPDGKPVAKARVSLSVRSQSLSMVEGELNYSGQFPVKLSQDELQTDDAGTAKFELPAADKPSRYVLTALATDGAAYRVRVTKEILVERGSDSFVIEPERRFSKPNETVVFKFSASPRPADDGGGAPSVRPARWEWLRLESRSAASGDMPVGDRLSLRFAEPGSYTVTLRDDKGRIVGATSHWVSGDGLKAPAGSVTMVFNRASYRTGDVAEALLSFAEPVDHALLTLERDRVEATALLGQRAPWVSSERISPTQWKIALPVREQMSPNMTLSVAYVKNGDYVFQNQGVLVEQPRITLSMRTAKSVYAPGETVEVEVATQLAGKPVAAEVTVSVVDEMIYVLQPEIAPSIEDFFYHPRRNNVRTSASLSFIGYDLATRRLGTLPSSRQVNQRAIKVLERPRRDNVDTAAWQPRLSTDAGGRARFAFTMPDSLTRWRITGRAIEARGAVGQQVAWLRSDKPFYAKWTSPNWQREGDRAQATVALFNQTGKPARVEWQLRGAGPERKDTVNVQPGANFLALPLSAERIGAANLALSLAVDGRVVDQLETPLQRLPVAWRGPRETALDISSGSVALNLPADASRVRVSLNQDAAAAEFNRSMDELIEFPYGCVEQTASRMLPLVMALQSLAPAQQALAPMLTQRLAAARLALAQMAGPQAQFGWWGRGMDSDPFLTAYAYYADWQATQALRMSLPGEHWQGLLEVYAKAGPAMTALQRALALSWMQEMGLPTASMLGRLVEQLAQQPPGDAPELAKYAGSLALADNAAPGTRDIALVLAAHSAALAKAPAGAEQRAATDAAAARLAGVDSPFVQALLMYTRRQGNEKAGALLGQARAEMPTFDRAQTLLWLQRALGRRPAAAGESVALPAPWRRELSTSGVETWHWPAGLELPATLSLPAGSKAAWAFVSYESKQAQAAALPVAIERTLWRVVPLPRSSSGASKSDRAEPGAADLGRIGVKLEAVAPGTALDTNTLYLDQIKLSADKPLRWALVEAALPPGAAVESGTWGIDIVDSGRTQALEQARHEVNAQGYAVPVDRLAATGPLTLRHLVRFSQRGQFKLPPARVHRMYQPEAKGFETGSAWSTIEVR